MHISSTKSQFRPQLRSHLPKEVSSQGASASDMAKACGDYVSDVKSGRVPAHDPYGSSLSKSEKVALSQDLQELGLTSQTDFAAQAETAGASLKLGQLQGALQSLQTETQNDIKELSSQRKSLKSAYHKQVAKTVGWMAGTTGALVVGGILPNPLSVLGVGVMATMTIRSIGKARAAQKNLAQHLPQIQSNIKVAQEVLSKTVSYGPHVMAWNGALNSEALQAA